MSRKTAAKPDLQFYNAGPFVTCSPISEAGLLWIDDNLAGDYTEFNGAICIEPRYLENIVISARADGLVCNG